MRKRTYSTKKQNVLFNYFAEIQDESFDCGFPEHKKMDWFSFRNGARTSADLGNLLMHFFYLFVLW